MSIFKSLSNNMGNSSGLDIYTYSNRRFFFREKKTDKGIFFISTKKNPNEK